MKRPLAPYLPETPAGTPDPIREMREREKNAVAKRIVDPRRASVEAAGVDGAATLPKPSASTTQKPSEKPSASSTNGSPKTGAASPPASPTKGSPDPASSSEGAETDSAADSDDSPGQATPEKAAAPEAKGPRYDVKSFKKWAEQNPEQAAEIAAEVFRVDQDPKQEWIRQQNKARKIKEDVRREKETAAAELAQERANIDREVARVEKIANEIRHISEMWGAAKRVNVQGQPDPDFDTVDETFRMNTGMTLDDYNRLRARRGVANPEVARLRAENARLARLAAAGQTNGAAKSGPGDEAARANPDRHAAVAAPTEPPAPAAPAVNWDGEVPKAHPLRQFSDWQAELNAEMAKYHDDTLDEYSRDPEEIATALFKRKMKALAGDEEDEAPAPRRAAPKVPSGGMSTPRKRTGKTAFSDAPAAPGVPSARDLAPRGPVNSDRTHKETTLQEIVTSDGGLANRERWAIERARARMRGEPVDD